MVTKLLLYAHLLTNVCYSQINFPGDFFNYWKNEISRIDTVQDLSFLFNPELSDVDSGFIITNTYRNGSEFAGFVWNNFEQSQESYDYYYCKGDTVFYFITNQKNNQFSSFDCCMFVGVQWKVTLSIHESQQIRCYATGEINGIEVVFSNDLITDSMNINSIHSLSVLMDKYYQSPGELLTRSPKSFPEYWLMFHSKYLRWEDIFITTEEPID